jgi:hypothetical protein
MSGDQTVYIEPTNQSEDIFSCNERCPPQWPGASTNRMQYNDANLLISQLITCQPIWTQR